MTLDDLLDKFWDTADQIIDNAIAELEDLAVDMAEDHIGQVTRPQAKKKTSHSRPKSNPKSRAKKSVPPHIINLYDVLEVSPRASQEAISGAYRSLAMKWHPDKNPGNAQAEKRMREINAAYAVLSDSVKRKAYDFASGVHRGTRG